MSTPHPLKDAINQRPLVYDVEALTDFRDAVGGALRRAGVGDDAVDFLETVASCSPYLRRLMQRTPQLAVEILNTPPEDMTTAAARDALESAALETKEAQLAGLRRAKDKASLTIALADIAGYWDVMEAAKRLSQFADAAVDAALAMALKKQKSDVLDSRQSGIGVIAMGKHGAFELNYSSDIDLVVVFDPDTMQQTDAHEAQALAVRATRDMVHALQTQTAEGYVFRTDLRLRPDPGATAAALSIYAAETYYEAYGQNWERAAYIKARAAAGDIAVGEKLLSALRPFVWRKYLDYAAIEDVKSVKRQIHATKGGGDIEFFGHDLKLGRGGIREIEFYAQTQQLILGGKAPALRVRETLAALKALQANGAVSKQAADELADDYRYLRQVEHRLQMVNDEQTHRMPKSEAEAARIAAFLGVQNVSELRARIETTLRRVHDHFADLFEYEKQLSSEAGSLIFTGVDNHPATLETLSKMGFCRAADISEVIRKWHAGSIRATRTQRARELLTKLIPPLLEALSEAGDADDAFFAFNDFLTELPAGVQVFSLLANNPEIFETLIRIMTISPYLGRELSKRMNFVEQLLEHQWSAPPPAPEDYAERLKAALQGCADYESQLNGVRRWAGEERFRITAQLAVGLLPPDEAAKRFTAIADAAIAALIPAAQKEMESAHGKIDGDLVVLGFGRLGAGEMTAVSDVDLTFIYDAPADAESTGKKSLGAVQYYTRLVRRIVTALSAATEEGALYEVDMQLRPSGRAGPAAVSLSAFSRYYEEEAWTWELMALAKVRVLFGSQKLADKINTEIDVILTRSRDASKLSEDVIDMRARIAEAKPAASPFHIKYASGGITEINFICQFLALNHGAHIGRAPRAPKEAIAFFEANELLSSADAARLTEALNLFEAAHQVSRAAMGGAFKPDEAGAALKSRMTELVGAENIEDAATILTNQQGEVARIYRSVIGCP